MTEIVTPGCPNCGGPPMMVFGGGTQAFCGTFDCSVLTWDPSKSLDGNLLNASVVEVRPGADDERSES